MKKDHLLIVFSAVLIAMFICTTSLCMGYVKSIVKYNDAKAYINRLENDFPDYIDVSAESDEYINYYNTND